MDLLDSLIAFLLTLLDERLGLTATAIGGAIAFSLRSLLSKYLDAKGMVAFEEALEIARRRIGEALLRGLDQSKKPYESGRVDDALGYVNRTMAETIESYGFTDADLLDRAIAEDRRRQAEATRWEGLTASTELTTEL